MSPVSPPGKSSTASDPATSSLPLSPQSQEARRLSINASRRSSTQSIKQALVSRSRANSMVSSRRGSRAPSHVTVTGQDVVAVPADFDNLDAGEWNFDLDNVDLNQVDMFDGSDGFNAFGNTVGLTNTFAPPIAPLAHYQQYPAYDQFGQPLQPGWMDGASIDPRLLSQQPIGLVDSTHGLTAVPGAAESMHQAYSMQYADPSLVMQQAQPYYPTAAYEQTGYIIEEPAIEQAPQAAQAPARHTNKRSFSALSSDDEGSVNKRQRAASFSDAGASPELVKRAGRRQSRDSGCSSESSLGNLKTHVPRAGEKPKKDEAKPWVRINGNTKGETTRTARINKEAAQQLDGKYKCKPLPNGNWKSSRYEFEYVQTGGIHEFQRKKMSARQVAEYIIEYPSDDLRLWIQVAPADVARRYASPAHSKCLFEDCPKHLWGDSGTIDIGHYRVGFDEKFKAYGDKTVDPFDCPGFVHLYCLERFCNFEMICANADIQVDSRHLPVENKQAKWTMSGRPEAKYAEKFIKGCQRGKLRSISRFAQYPIHVSHHSPKAFEGTLVAAMVEVNIDSRTRSQTRQFIDRKLTPNVLMINRGDMEVAMTQKKIKHSKAYKRAIRDGHATAASFDYEAYYDEYDPIINERIRHYRNLKAQWDADDAAGPARKSKSKAAPKRKRAAVDSDEESDDDDAGYPGPSRTHHTGRRRRNAYDDDSDHEPDVPAHTHRHGTRTSPRNRQRINYATDEQPAMYEQRIDEPYLEQGYRQASPTRRNPIGMLQWFPNIRQDDPTYSTAPVDAAPMDAAQLDAMIDAIHDGLQRRKSSSMSTHSRHYAGITKPSRSPRRRQASFAAHPVSSEQEYHVNDPPSQLVATPGASSPMAIRRSERIAHARH